MSQAGVGAGILPARSGRLQRAKTHPYWGIACLLAGILVFSFQDVIIKRISGIYPVHEVMTIRSLIAMPLLVGIVAYGEGIAKLWSRRVPLLLGRGTVMFLAYGLYYLSLPSLPLAIAVSLYFTGPLFITILSVWFLHERVGARQWLAVLAGFLGVLIIVRPASEVFHWAALLPVAAGLAYAASQVATRRLGESESAVVMSAYANAVYFGVGILLSAVFASGGFAGSSDPSLDFLMRGWIMPNATDLLLMMACGLIASAGLILLTEAYRVARASVVAPFEYTALIYSVLFGWVFWSELPDAIGWIGMAVILASGVYILRSENI